MVLDKSLTYTTVNLRKSPKKLICIKELQGRGLLERMAYLRGLVSKFGIFL